MNLLFQPEELSQLQRRFSAALTPIYTPEMIRAGQKRANEQRKHVFDFEDGTRLTISHEQLGQRIYLHATGSMDRRCVIRADNFKDVCYVKLCQIAGKSLTIYQADIDALSIHLLCEPLLTDGKEQRQSQPAQVSP